MIVEIVKKLGEWIEGENQKLFDGGSLPVERVEIYIIGQTALLEAELSIEVAATMDVDCYKELSFKVSQKFDELLRQGGRHLDLVGHEAWMPEETEYRCLYESSVVMLFIAEPVYVILSKAKVAIDKNRNLIIDYLASSDLDERIFNLAVKYNVDLENL